MVLRYFGIRVSNLNESIKFYTRLLGLKEAKRGKMSHGGIRVLLQDTRSRQRLELNWYPNDSPYAKYSTGDGLDHIGFKVKDPEHSFKTLLKRGASPALTPRDKDGIKGVYYARDPDGNWIEFF